MNVRQWYRVENLASDPTVAEIHIIDFIGDWIDDQINRMWGENIGLTARAFIEALAALPETVKAIHVHINSPGGDVQGGINIANALRDQQLSKGRAVETFIDGIAASIASVIAMAGSKVHMGDNALLMIHNPMSVSVGTAADMRKVADILDTMRGQIINTYQWHSSMDAPAIATLMDAETWMNADEALANGFVTDKVAGLKAAAALDPRGVSALKVPDRYRDRVNAWLATPPAKATAPEVLRACTAGGCLELAEDLIATNATTAQVTAKVDAAKAAKAAATTRATQITALCGKAKLPQLAEEYIAGAMTVEAVGRQLTTITAVVDKAEIDTGLRPDATSGGKSAISTIDVYASRNALNAKP